MDLQSVQDLKGVLRRDFFHGYATAAAQVEGAWNKDGKGQSIWDTFAHTPGKVKDGSTGDDAVRSYDLYKEDVALMKSYGSMHTASPSLGLESFLLEGATTSSTKRGLNTIQILLTSFSVMASHRLSLSSTGTHRNRWRIATAAC